ncbi:Uncharacterised protein [Burkholderia pseudomallei]|nr:Uncharacterised protein [Burkholderia pseudomallei]
MKNFRIALAAACLALISHATYAWTVIVSGPYVEGPSHHYGHNFYASDVWPSKGGAQYQAWKECRDDNDYADLWKECKSIAEYDGPTVIALITGEDRYWAVSANPDTNAAVGKGLAACHRAHIEGCKLSDVTWDFGHNRLDAPESFKQLYMKLHDGRYWQPVAGYWH